MKTTLDPNKHGLREARSTSRTVGPAYNVIDRA